MLGVLTGVMLSFLVVHITSKTHKDQTDEESAEYAEDISDPESPAADEDAAVPDITYFDKPGETVESHSVKVFQALDPGFALATGRDEIDLYYGIDVLLTNDEGTPYYDKQIVKAPKGKSFRQVGIYRYKSGLGVKTVPVVKLMDK